MQLENLLFRAALLAHCKADARPLARAMARAVRGANGRSCFDAGSPIQFAVDAPGQRELQVALRLGERPTPELLEALVADWAAPTLGERMAALPRADHDSFGTWLHWRASEQALYFDLRDQDPAAALARLASMLDASEREQLAAAALPFTIAQPWAAKISVARDTAPRVLVYWLLNRHAPVQDLADATVPGAWRQVVGTLGQMLKRPGRAGRWVLTTQIGAAKPRVRLNNTGWVLVPETDRKQRALGRAVEQLGGPRQYAEALWSLCRGTADSRWRVGRACEVSVADGALGARWYLTAQVAA